LFLGTTGWLLQPTQELVMVRWTPVSPALVLKKKNVLMINVPEQNKDEFHGWF